MNNAIHVTGGIVCEDIRLEHSRKYILIGCYGRGVFVPSTPAPISLMFAAIINSHQANDVLFEFKVVAPNGDDLYRGETRISEVNDDHDAIFPVGPLQFQVETEGDMLFQYKLNDEWITVKHFNVKVGTL